MFNTVLESVNYLPSEVLNKRNFPIIAQFQDELSLVFVYYTAFNDALADYTAGVTDKIDLNANDLNTCIELTRLLCNAFGSATPVCFDILASLRECLYLFQQVAYAADQFSDQYVGVPTSGGSTI